MFLLFRAELLPFHVEATRHADAQNTSIGNTGEMIRKTNGFAARTGEG